jgi:hypothetical protein
MDQSEICPNCNSSNLEYEVRRTWSVPSDIRLFHFSAHCRSCRSQLWCHHDPDELPPPAWISGDTRCGCASQ